MKKFILTMVAALCMCFTTFAQNGPATVEGARFFNNTYMTVTVGGQVGMNDLTGHQNWTVTPTTSLYFGKWVTPAFGLEFDGDVLYHDSFRSRNRGVDATYLGLNARLNLNNLFRAYSGVPNRVEVIPFVGFGWLHGYGDGVEDLSNGVVPTVMAIGPNAFGTKMGVDVAFNMGKQRAWQINVRPTVMYALTGANVGRHNPKYNVNQGRVGLEAGVTYKFGYKNSKRDRVHNFTRGYSVAEYDAMVAQLSAAKPAERIVVTDTVEIVKEVPVEVAVEKPVFVLTSPYFTQGKYRLDPTTDVILSAMADEMKESGKKYVITGYASVEGVEKFNERLSLNRANAVKNALVQRGVKAENLRVVAGGPTDKFGKQYELNRKVEVTEE